MANINNHHPLLNPVQVWPFTSLLAPCAVPFKWVSLVLLLALSNSLVPISILSELVVPSVLTLDPYGLFFQIRRQKSRPITTKIIMTPNWKAIPANIKLEAASGEGVTDAAHPPPIACKTRETISAVRKIARNYFVSLCCVTGTRTNLSGCEHAESGVDLFDCMAQHGVPEVSERFSIEANMANSQEGREEDGRDDEPAISDVLGR